MAASKKHFGTRKGKPAEPLTEVEFEVEFERDGEFEEYTFRAKPQITYSDMVALKKHESDDQGAVLPYLDRMIRRALRNDDGTPIRWRAEPKGGKFTAPDGSEQPVADLAKFTAHEAGSSRRRWVELVESDDATIHIDDVMNIFEYFAEVAADRPTERPQRS